MEWIQISGIAAAAAFCALSLKKYAPETAVLLSIMTGAVIFTAILSKVSPIVEQLQSMNISWEYAQILIQTLGISLLCQFVSDACRDAGQGSLSSKVELAAKVTIIINAMPLFKNILNTAAELMK